MSPEQKELMRQQVYPALQYMLHTMEFANEVKRITLDLAHGEFDPELIYNRLLDAQDKMRDDCDDDFERICRTLFLSTGPEMQSEWAKDEWKAKLHAKRLFRKRRERYAG